SLGLDLATAIDVTLLDQRPQKIPSTITGPLILNNKPQGALLIGCSSSGIRVIPRLFVLPGLIDTDYKGVISVVVQTLFPPIHIPAGSKIAQLIPLPQLTVDMQAVSQKDRGTDGFGSTGGIALLTLLMNRRPVVTATLCSGHEQLNLEALLDTGADLTIVD
ncbi:Endogenous retrovirus group K member 9 Pol protein, partial [Eudyptula albosignata]